MRRITYTFEPVESCNLCGSDSSNFLIKGKRLNGNQGFNPRNKTGITTTVVRCKNCGLTFSNPTPIPAKLSDHYDIPAEDYWISEYFKVNENDYAGLISLAKKYGDIKPGDKILDIGAGIGKCMIAFERAGYDVWGFEPSEPFYRKAIQTMKVNPERIKMAAIENADYEENFFDFITFGAVLEHLYNPSESILTAIKWLKPNGIIHIEVPSSDWLINDLINFAYRVRGLDYVGNISPMHEPFHIYEFALKSFQEHAKKHGYEITNADYYVCKTYMPSLLDPMLKWYMAKTKKGMQLAVLLRKL